MVDPSKTDQFYQQRLAPWATAGYGSHPSLSATTSASSFPPNLYDASRLHHSLAGLHPTPPSAAAATAAAAASAYKEPRSHTYGSHYPMNLAALSALSGSDFQRPHGLHQPPSSSSGSAQQAPLPAHLPRHQSYPNYHDTYAGYYNNGSSIHGGTPHGQVPPPRGGQSTSHNGYEPPPPSYAIPGLKDYSSRSQPTGHHKQAAHTPQQQQPPVHDSNGYKVAGATGTGVGATNHYPPPFSYPTQNGPPTQAPTSGYPSYPFDVSKLGYQFSNQQAPPPPAAHHPLALTSNKPQSQPPNRAVPTSDVVSNPPNPSLLRGSLMRPTTDPASTVPVSVAENHYHHNGVDMTSRQPVPLSNAAAAPPNAPMAPSAVSTANSQPSYLRQLVSASPLPMTQPPPHSRPPPAVLATSNAFPLRSPSQVEATAGPPPTKVTSAVTDASKIKDDELNNPVNASSVLKRKPSLPQIENVAPVTAYEPEAKKIRLSDDATTPITAPVTPAAVPPKPDPYSFVEEDDFGSSSQGAELTRFGSGRTTAPPPSLSESSPVPSPGPNGSTGGYKFKSALLSRNYQYPELPKLSSKSVPLAFEVQSNVFVESCDRFIEDMNSKPMSVSRRASVESFMAAQAAKAARKAERKAEKEQQKAEAAERKAEREERKEKEKLGVGSPPLTPQAPPHQLTSPQTPAVTSTSLNISPEKTSPETSPEKLVIGSPVASPDKSSPEKSPEKSPKKRARKNSSKKGVKVEEDQVGQNEVESLLAALTPMEDIKENEPNKALTNNNSCSTVKEEKPKKSGGTWALPIVPKMPQKPQAAGEKRKGLVSLPKVASLPKTKKKEAEAKNVSSQKPNANQGLASVWLQAFGAKPSLSNNKGIKQEIGVAGSIDSKEKLQDIKIAKKTYLDIPPEKRRRPKPAFGGLIHFSPDWERAVQKHHEKARLPQNLIDAIRVSLSVFFFLI